jgi:hypothetical protein
MELDEENRLFYSVMSLPGYVFMFYGFMALLTQFTRGIPQYSTVGTIHSLSVKNYDCHIYDDCYSPSMTLEYTQGSCELLFSERGSYESALKSMSEYTVGQTMNVITGHHGRCYDPTRVGIEQLCACVYLVLGCTVLSYVNRKRLEFSVPESTAPITESVDCPDFDSPSP